MTNVSRRFGIVVGVSDFAPNEQISRIPYATNDAARVYETLRDHCNFSTERLYLLASIRPNDFDGNFEAPTRPNILNVLKYVADTAGEDDVIMLFIASHGVEISSVPYLLTADTRMNVLKETAIDTNEINDILRSSSARCVVRMFDACRSPFSIARSSAGLMTTAFEQAMFMSATGWATLSSCSTGEYSYESGDFEQGVFSYYLCEGIGGKAANSEGRVTLEGLVEYTKISLSNWSNAETLKQTPHFQSDLSGVLVLSSPQPQVSTSPSVKPEHPLSALQSGMRQELAATAADARHLQFTSKDGASTFAEIVKQAIEQLVADFADSNITITVNEVKGDQLQYTTHDAWLKFNEDMDRLRVKPEFVDHPTATAITFVSNEVVVPTSTLIVACARFSFFYWLWYLHACDVPVLQNRFKPKPPFHTGMMTFKVASARDSEKVESSVREVLARSGLAILEWTQQLKSYVDTRLGPLREQKTIVE